MSVLLRSVMRSAEGLSREEDLMGTSVAASLVRWWWELFISVHAKHKRRRLKHEKEKRTRFAMDECVLLCPPSDGCSSCCCEDRRELSNGPRALEI